MDSSPGATRSMSSTRTAPNASSSPRSRSRRATRRGDERDERAMSIAAGLCSITFRSLSADAVLDVAVRAGVEGIEWGADGHAPPGGGAAVDGLATRCRDAGVDVVSYGSYLGF